MKQKVLTKQAIEIIQADEAIILAIAKYLKVGYEYVIHKLIPARSRRLTEIGVLLIINKTAKVKDITTLVQDLS